MHRPRWLSGSSANHWLGFAFRAVAHQANGRNADIYFVHSNWTARNAQAPMRLSSFFLIKFYLVFVVCFFSAIVGQAFKNLWIGPFFAVVRQ